MAILSKDEFFNRISKQIGNDTSDDSIAFMEDMTDTYNDLERKTKNDGVDWEQKCKEVDAAWKAKYTHRFFNGGASDSSIPTPNADESDGYNPDDITVDSLFKKEGK